MPAQTTNLFLLRDIGSPGGSKGFTDSDLSALRAVANWIESFVARPHGDLGRSGPVCPFVPWALERDTLWLAPERIAGRSLPDIIQVLSGYRELLLRAQPMEGERASCKAIVVVFSDLAADGARDFFGNADLQQLKRLSYGEQGVVMGEFHPGNVGSAIRNQFFQPFKAPVPFLLMRPAVISDWMFFLDDEEWFGLWKSRYGETATPVLGEMLRRTEWRRVASS